MRISSVVETYGQVSSSGDGKLEGAADQVISTVEINPSSAKIDDPLEQDPFTGAVEGVGNRFENRIGAIILGRRICPVSCHVINDRATGPLH